MRNSKPKIKKKYIWRGKSRMIWLEYKIEGHCYCSKILSMQGCNNDTPPWSAYLTCTGYQGVVWAYRGLSGNIGRHRIFHFWDCCCHLVGTCSKRTRNLLLGTIYLYTCCLVSHLILTLVTLRKNLVVNNYYGRITNHLVSCESEENKKKRMSRVFWPQMW